MGDKKNQQQSGSQLVLQSHHSHNITNGIYAPPFLLADVFSQWSSYSLLAAPLQVSQLMCRIVILTPKYSIPVPCSNTPSARNDVCVQ